MTPEQQQLQEWLDMLHEQEQYLQEQYKST
jgi:hypothetical protein